MTETKVLIGIPNGSGYFPAAMVRSLLELKKPVPCAVGVIERTMIEAARNSLCMEAIKSGATHLLMVDDDNPIPDDTLEFLLSDDKDIVIAPILGRNPKNGVHPLCAFYSRTVKVDGGEIKLYDNIFAFRDEGPLHQIDAGGTGCMLIKTTVLQTLYDIYRDRIFERSFKKFKEPVTINGQQYDSRTMSEDVEFCERAANVGFEIWLDERVRPLHMVAPKFIQYT